MMKASRVQVIHSVCVCVCVCFIIIIFDIFGKEEKKSFTDVKIRTDQETSGQKSSYFNM